MLTDQTRTAERRRTVRRHLASRRPAAPLSSATSDMLAAVAHELGTPIHSLSATVDFLVEDFGELGRDEQQAMLERLQRSASWLRGLAQNIRLLANTTPEADQLDLGPVPLQECIEDAVMLAKPLLERRGQRLTVEAPAEPVVVHGDRTGLGQVLVNLLTNAAKYSVAGDSVELRLRVDGAEAELSVTDHGPGIPEAEQSRIFRRYVQGSAHAGSGSGLGIGLSIVHALAARHGGRVELRSAVGQGSTFSVRLPLAS
jgi:signal transduction histidine kinase